MQCPEGDLREQIRRASRARRVSSRRSARRLGSISAGAGDFEVARYRMFRAVRRLLGEAAAHCAVLVVCDDLHWADPPTLAMLKHVMRGETAPILVVGTYRDVEITQPPARRRARVAISRADRRTYRAGRARRRRGRVVHRRRGRARARRCRRAFAHALHTETSGNPFFIEEILLHFVETGRIYRDGDRWTSDASSIEALGIPEGVREAVERRLARLDEVGYTVSSQRRRRWPRVRLRGAARDVARWIPSDMITSLEQALDAQLFAEAHDGPARRVHRHAIVRQVLYESWPSNVVSACTVRAAEAIEAEQGSVRRPKRSPCTTGPRGPADCSRRKHRRVARGSRGVGGVRLRGAARSPRRRPRSDGTQ